ncbi:hypothetical protein [Bufonid herpesvirus 1]|uniref:hypothetical protein n=1 Tax=Bufonid herpesvirus 1 TaxID=2282206 RepID=UPI000EB6C7F1|nr:hypothetical protein [Bufonid herpesvirus 1]AXF48645.1 hypothetical protein [Bufonid herpesvirus 1]
MVYGITHTLTANCISLIEQQRIIIIYFFNLKNLFHILERKTLLNTVFNIQKQLYFSLSLVQQHTNYHSFVLQKRIDLTCVKTQKEIMFSFLNKKHNTIQLYIRVL